MSKIPEILQANWSRRAELMEKLRAIDEKAVEEKRDYTDDERADATSTRSELKSIDERMSSLIEIEARDQQLADGMAGLVGALVNRDSGETVDTRSLGERFAEDDQIRSWVEAGASGQSPRIRFDGIDLRAVTTVTAGSATSAGAFIVPTRLDRVGKDFLDRKVFLADLLPSIPISNGAAQYVQDKTPLADLADAAVEVAENSAKSQGGPTLAVVNEALPVIAEWVNITRQAARYAAQVQAYLDQRLRYALRRRVDKQVIGGNGTPPNVLGLNVRSGIVTYAPGSAEARYVSIRHGIRLMEDVESVPEIIVLNPADAELFDLSNSTTAGLHAVEALDQNPGDWPTKSAWGMTQVRSTAVAAGTALLIDPMAVAVLDGMAPTAFLTDSHASNFVSNVLTLLLEVEAGLAVFNPKGVELITFNGTA